jgi:hypothetical protein
VRRRFLTSAWRHSILPAKKIPEHRGPYSTSPGGDADAATDAADAADSAADAADSASDSVADADAADAVADASDSDASDSAWVGGAEAAAGAAGSADRAPDGEGCGLGVVMFGQRSTRPLSRFAQMCLGKEGRRTAS